ncbi:MAG TPA: hypothetical protein PLB31_10350 [Fimbriimonadaceae bacterium]|nr:hypothetical protein [Fimbriimonadaceae bacterium]HRI74856.1 hypothetical protein [Fimbriimonadaceae bacterium]
MPMTKRAKWGWALAAVTCPVVMLWGMWRTFIGEPVVEVMQTLEGPGWTVVLQRVNYHSTVPFVYEVKACGKDDRCEVVFKAQRLNEETFKATRLSDHRVAISAVGAELFHYSNFFYYEPVRGAVLNFELDGRL